MLGGKYKFLFISFLLVPQVVFGKTEKEKCIDDVKFQATFIFNGSISKNDLSYSMGSKYTQAAINNESLLQKYKTEIFEQQYNQELQDCEKTIATEDIIKTNSCGKNYIRHDTASCRQGQKLKDCAEEYCTCHAEMQSDIQTPKLYEEALIKATCDNVDGSAEPSNDTQAQNASDKQKVAKRTSKKPETKKADKTKTNTPSNTTQSVETSTESVSTTPQNTPNETNPTNLQTGTITVTGVIKDSETNETIPMATVIAVTSNGNAINKDEGGVLGIASNITDGKFELSNVPSDAQIKISCVGYQDQIVSAGQNLDIKLVKSTEMLDEVEVVVKKTKEGDSCEKPEEKIKKGQYKKIDGIYVCVPTECEAGLVVNDGKCSQKELQKDNKDTDNTKKPTISKEELAKKEKNVQELKENEQSLENRTLGAVSMAATGIGGMELAMGLAEQNADKDADADMTAYIETFRCEYANGKSVKNGATNVELPSDTLFDLYQEYIALAADLKERKEQLGLAPGIESEVIIDKATAGLYDDKASEKTNGTFASIYRAKMGNETDRAKLQEMSDTSKKRVKGGAIAAGAGALIGIVGNVFINNKKKVKDLSNDEFNQFVSNQESYQKQMETIKQCILTNKNPTEDIVKKCIGKK